MNKFFSTVMCVLVAVGAANAQLVAPGILSSQNTKSYANIVTEKNANRSNAMAYDTDNSLFTAGVFDTEFAGLEPIAASSYIMKNGADLTPSWKVALQGAATVTCLLPDGQGGVYAAGNFADEVSFGSTDNKTQIKEGYKESGAFTTSQCAAFVAHYDNDGKLIKVSSIIPAHDPALDATGMYFPADGDIYCNINSLALNGSDLYVGFNYSGKIDSTPNSITSGSMDMEFGGFYYQATKAAGVAKLNDDLSIASFIANIHGNNFKVTSEIEQTYSSHMTIADGHLYLGTIANGLSNIALPYLSDGISVSYQKSESGIYFGYMLMDIDLAKNSTKIATWLSPTEDSFSASTISDLYIKGDEIILTGNFQGGFPFDNSIKAVGSSDMYIAAVSKNALTTSIADKPKISWFKTSGYDEGDKTKNEELFTSGAVCGDYIFINGYADQKSGHAFIAPLSYIYNIKDGSLTKLDVNNYTFGIAAASNSSLLANAYSASPVTGITFSDYKVTQAGVNDIAANANDVTAYPNPATDVLNFSNECDVEIAGINGAVVAAASGVTSINVEALPAGIYFAKTTTASGTSVVKIIKK